MTPEQQVDLLSRGTEEILPAGQFLERLERCERERRPLRVKQGFDPTAPDIHLGHTVGLRKLRQFQDLGHQVILIIGDYTGMVGDPSGRSKTRPQLTPDVVEANARTYLEQFYRVLDPGPQPPRLPVEVHRNGEWFSRMSFMDVMRLASQHTVARMLERDDFSQRFAARQPISIHELFYPLMQGYDSVAIRSDVELGATEQKFNLLVGRAMQELHGQAPQIVLTLPVLPGLDGVMRMSKSVGNYVGVTEPPSEMYGKVMSLPDSAMAVYWRLVADRTEAESRELERDLGLTPGSLDACGGPAAPGADAAADTGLATHGEQRRVNPMLVKKRLAHRIASMYHGLPAANRAQRDFETQFSRHAVPDDLRVWRVPAVDDIGIKDVLVQCGLASSGSAAWRAVDQGAVSIDGVKITDRQHRQPLTAGFVLRLGRRMVRVEPGPESGQEG